LILKITNVDNKRKQCYNIVIKKRKREKIMKKIIQVTSIIPKDEEVILINPYQIESVFSQGKQGSVIRMVSG